MTVHHDRENEIESERGTYIIATWYDDAHELPNQTRIKPNTNSSNIARYWRSSLDIQ